MNINRDINGASCLIYRSSHDSYIENDGEYRYSVIDEILSFATECFWVTHTSLTATFFERFFEVDKLVENITLKI